MHQIIEMLLKVILLELQEVVVKQHLKNYLEKFGQNFRNLFSPKSFNNKFGVPLSLLNLKQKKNLEFLSWEWIKRAR